MIFFQRTFRKYLTPTLLRLFAFTLLLGVALAQVPAQNAQAQAGAPQLILTKTVDDDIISAKVGEIIFFRIRFACSSLTTDCGDVEIVDALPTNPNPPNSPLFTYVEALSSVPAGFHMTESPAGTLTITKDDKMLLDGSQYDAVIAARVNYEVRPLPATVGNEARGRIKPPGATDWTLPVTSVTPGISIEAPVADWTLTKSLYSPSIEPTVNTDVTYRISLCPDITEGNVALTNITMTDTLPTHPTIPGLRPDFISASNGGTYNSGTGEVTWNIAGPITPPACATRYITMRFDSADGWAVGNTLTNTAAATGEYLDSSGGVCVPPNCVDTGSVPLGHNIINIVETPSYSKNDVGDPVGIDGTARFTLNLNTNGTNYPANSVVMMDTLPGELQVVGVTSGTWDVNDHVRATIQYATNYAPTPPNWTPFPGQPVEYDDDALYELGLPTNITRVRWVFEYDSDPDDLDGDLDLEPLPGLPFDWSFASVPQIRVIPRKTATTSSDGVAMPVAETTAPNNVYTNCLQVSRVNSGGSPVTGACDNETMTVEGNFVSLRTTKAETPGYGYDPVADPNIDTFTADDAILPNDTIRYTLTVEVTERSSVDLVNPVIQDTLPVELNFVRNGEAKLDGVVLANQPHFYRSGSTLTWAWTDNPIPPGILFPPLAANPLTVPAEDYGSHYLTVEFYGYVKPGTAPADYTNTLYVVTDTGDVNCEVGTELNDALNGDIDNDSVNPETACRNTDTFKVERSAALRGEKWIRSIHPDNAKVALSTIASLPEENFTTDTPAGVCPDGGTVGLTTILTNHFTRYPCISQAYPEGALNPDVHAPPPVGHTDLDDFEYNLRIFNEGNVPMLEYTLYDILPYSGDRGSGGTLVNESRFSQFRPTLTGAVEFISGPGTLDAGDFLIEYSASINPCRPEVFDKDPIAYPNTPAGCTDDWMNAAAAAMLGWDKIRVYRIELISNSIAAAVPAGNELRFGVPMHIPADMPTLGVVDNDDAQSKEIAWNSYSHVGSYDKDIAPGIQIQDLLASEPRKVGITIPERFSIGNRVWRDSDNSGTINAPDDTDPGIANVTVNLYTDDNSDGLPDDRNGGGFDPIADRIATTTTDNDTADPTNIDKGYYLFSNLPAGRYIVGIPATNFAGGQPLENLRSSTGTPSSATYTTPADANPDSGDHGSDPIPSGSEATNGVYSPVIILSASGEQTAEADLSDDVNDGPAGTRRGLNGERDNNSDLTVDFGFFGGTNVPFSIGNHLWYDDGTGVGGVLNDGIRQAGELPVVGATLYIYRDGNGNGTPDAGERILNRSDVTDANGFYLFDNLDPGTYFVQVVPANFDNVGDPLDGWFSSQPTGTEMLGVNGGTNTADLDNDDNGVNTDIPEQRGVFSGPVVLMRSSEPGYQPEPSGEGYLSGQPDPGAPANANFDPTGWDGDSDLVTPGIQGSRGRFGETDETSNLTIDFGFIPPMSLGNRVWFDSGSTTNGVISSQFNDGIMNGTEVGAAGVRVELYRDTSGDGILQPGEFIRATTTDATGYYLFEHLQPATNYYIHIPDDNFGDTGAGDLVAGDPLLNYLSSTDRTAPADNATDINDNGIDNTAPLTNGITSQVIAMAYGSEPTTPPESDINPSGTYGPNNVGNQGQLDTSSNLTMDFGFIQPPRSIGNRLWFDNNNNRQVNGGEGPVVGARVSLYRDSDNGGNGNGIPDDVNGDGLFNASDALAFDVTDAGGFYLFDNLPPGRYLVGVDSDNFNNTGVGDMYTALVEYASSTNTDNTADNRDNGIDRPAPDNTPHGILSANINMTATGPQRTLETSISGQANPADGTEDDFNPTGWDGDSDLLTLGIQGSRGRFGETDENSNLWIDFGFYKFMSIGNRVWRDNGAAAGHLNNGIMDADESPIQNVRVELWRETNGTAGLQVSGTTPDTYANRFDTTDTNGYYLFDRLAPGNNYYIHIPDDNFANKGVGDTVPGDPLLGWYSSQPTGTETATSSGATDTASIDVDDNGVNNLHPDLNGISSGVINLVWDAEPSGETQLSLDIGININNNPTADDGPNSRGRWNESDDNSNLTIDFGFIPPLSLGNRVWIDSGNTATGTVFNQYDNGIMDGTEAGRANVTVSLYFDANNDGAITAAVVDGVAETTPYRTDITDAGGFYLFDGLPLGSFFVEVDASNFGAVGPLENYRSSTDQVAFDDEVTDINDNGIDDANYLTNGISSREFVLDYGGEPGGEAVSSDLGITAGFNPTADDGPAGIGRYGEVDSSSNLTADFGFVLPHSIGNRVWRDSDNSGTINAPDDANPGIPGVTINLYAGVDVVVNASGTPGSDGIPDDLTVLRTTTTDSAGFYLFDNLPAGNFIVGIPASNFAATQPLEALRSSTGTPSSATYTTPADANADVNDHGRDPSPSGSEATNGVFSPIIALAENEVTGETDLPANNPANQALYGTNLRGRFGETDLNSDLTVDFGFFGGSNIPFSIGNHLWYDDGYSDAIPGGEGILNDGIRQGDELPVVGATLYIYRDGNANGQPDAGERILNRSDVTDAGGFYLFDNLDPGTYFIQVIPDNFDSTGDPLDGWFSSQTTGSENSGVAGNPYTPNMDSDDNGVDTDFPDTRGVFSGPVILIRSSLPTDQEPSGETHLSGEVDPGLPLNDDFDPTGWDGDSEPLAGIQGSRGRFGETDATSNLTIDFGFIPPMSLGNRVWFDSGSTTNGVISSQFNDGIMNGTEAGAAGVRVELYRDTSGDGILQPGEFIRADDTDATGYYLFEYLQPATNYYIHIPDDNFGDTGIGDLVPGNPLLNYLSSTDRTAPLDDATDINDNGIDNTAPLTNGITSQVIAMAYTAEPQNSPTIPTPVPPLQTEIDLSADVAQYGNNNVGRQGQSDSSSNLTMDFGFIQQPRSIGNRLWYDNGSGVGGVVNDGILNGAEPPVDGARVSLYRDSNNNGIPDDVNGDGFFDASDALAFDTTVSGYYLFDNLPASVNYIVGVDAVNFQSGQPLFEYASSTNHVDNASNDTDSRDNGIDRILPGDVTASPYGVISTSINLATLSSIETDFSGNTTPNGFGNNPTAWDGPASLGRYGETNTTSDLTIDFGFFKPMSIGNRVWRDDGGTTGTINNGVMDGDEQPIANVRVELYRDTNNNGVLNIGAGDTLVNWDETDANGYYLFDRLTPVNYFVHIPLGNFDNSGDPLYGWHNSVPTFANDVDINDNGVNNFRPDLNGITSNLLALGWDSEPITESQFSQETNPADGTEDDFSPTGWDGDSDPLTAGSQGSRGRWNESDDNSDLTVDFGFIPSMSLGNRAWLDNGSTASGLVLSQFDDGAMNGDEPGIDNVALSLYFDSDYSGSITGAEATTAYRTTVTDADGYYLFDNLPPGRFFVEVDAANFTAALNGLLSSTGVTDNETGDINDNGQDSATYLADGIRSMDFVLDYNGEPTTPPTLSATESDLPAVNLLNQTAYGTDLRGRFGELDANSNLTLDFGFIAPPRSLGNRLWFDNNNNGVMDGGELPVVGAQVSLYSDDDNDGIPDGPALATDITDTVTTPGTGGFYLFSNLPPGNYLVGVDNTNFQSGQPLFGYTSSSGNQTNATDINDNGIDRILPGDATASPYGVLSNNIDLTVPAPTLESDLSNNAADGAPGYRGTHGETDANSDLTVDFGFHIPMSIGNRVWRDDGGTTGIIDNGIMDGDEAPIQNVRVELYRDTNNNGALNIGAGDTFIGYDTTDANGYYLFDNLPAGNYFVHIPEAQFDSGGPLFGLNNSSPAFANNVDINDNGVYNARPDLNGITSNLIALALTTEPTGETQLSGQADTGAPANAANDPTGWDGPSSRGRFGEADNNSNLTIDFGFLPVYSLGNRVWYDSGIGAGGIPTDGRINGTEPGAGNITVNLYLDMDDDGTPDDINVIGDSTDDIFATDTTDASGYYRFDNLLAGTYIVEVIPPNGYGSTTDFTLDADDNVDNDDNGVFTLPTGEIRSHPITLGDLPEPTTDNDAAPNPNLADGEAPNNQSNRTVDFGLIGSVAIGNVVWFDMGAGAGEYNNGILDAGEAGVNDVTVNLYFDADNDGSFTGSELTPYLTTITAFNAAAGGDGYYQFDRIIPGRYYVEIPASEFLAGGDLVGYTSSTDDVPPTTDETVDNNADENGRDVTSAVLTASGIRSMDYVLTLGGEPDGALDDETSYTGTIADNSVNFTADFGFTQVVAIGNRVWLDTSTGATYGNGRQDGGELGVEDITVELYRSGDPIGSPYRTTTTNTSGDYVFDGLRPGDYFVHIPAAEFQAGGDLIGYSSSIGQGTSQTTDQAGDENGSDNQPAVNGVSSPIYNLTLNGQPTLANSEDQSGYPGVLDDNDVNYTADFGFTRLVALGNVVWIDTGAGYNNGIYEPADENGVDDVTVNLYTSTGTFVATTTTANGGTYKFDNLLPGAYYVEIPNTAFDTNTDPLFGYISSTGSGATETVDNDADENGIDPVSPNTAATSGIRSMVYNLTAGGEPDTDDETSYRSDFDTDGQPDGKLDDTSVNLTADFGFTEAFSLGNRVWFDDDKGGTINDAEVGLPNVWVYLYRDSNDDSVPDDLNGNGNLTDDSIASMQTGTGGYYRFDNLIADTYIVEVTTPTGYASTVDAGDPDSDDGDDDDNGVTLVVIGAENRVRSDPVTLEPRTNNEPQTDNDPLTNPNPEAALGEAPNPRSNRTVDFGFILSSAASAKRLTGTIVMDTDPATGNPIAGTDFTSGTQVAIGEILTYEIRLEIPSGATFVNLTAVDQLDAGLAFVDCDSITAPNLTTTLASFNDACNPDLNPTVHPQSTPESQNDARQITFSLGNVQNATADTQTITITYRVIVLDIPSNRDGINGLNNSVVWSWVGTTLPPVPATPVEVVEPALSIDKNATPQSSEYGRNITFTIQIAHTAASSIDAFDVVVTDILPTGLQYVAGSASFAGLAPNVPTPPADYYNAATSTLTFEWDAFPLGQMSTITFQATFVGPAPVVNSANVAWTSLPIDPQPSGQPVSLSPFNNFSTERWYDPADLTGLNAYRSGDSVSISLPENADRGNKKAWVLPATGFAPNMVTELPPMPEGFAYAQTDILLEIPKIRQSLKIAGVPYDSEKREWNLTWLNNEAGWLETTAFPTHSGNSALTAHTTLPSGQPGPFAKLGSLSYGDQVIVRFGGQKYIFEVRENKQVKPTEVNSVLKHEEYPWLTLITCKSYNEKTGEYTYRTVVRAVLIDVIDE